MKSHDALPISAILSNLIRMILRKSAPKIRLDSTIIYLTKIFHQAAKKCISFDDRTFFSRDDDGALLTELFLLFFQPNQSNFNVVVVVVANIALSD